MTLTSPLLAMSSATPKSHQLLKSKWVSSVGMDWLVSLLAWQMKWGQPDAEAIKKFLVDDKGFAEARVESALKRLEVIP